jgi:predicted HicB family RNase H-like nuclease
LKNTLTYKGFEGSVEYSAEDDILHGRILNIEGLYASYEGKCLESLKSDFIEAVEFHLSPDETIKPVRTKTRKTA